MQQRPLCLVSNDDGYQSEGLQTLRRALETSFDVVVVAPEVEQSAASHALSLHRPLRLRKVEEGMFALDGTPADCVYVALFGEGRALPRRPDIVLSGINRGLNLGQDAFYSGTIAAAREGALRKIPALALSAQIGADLVAIAKLGVSLAQDLLAHRAGEAALLSLNVPKAWSGETRGARLGSRLYEDRIYFRTDPRDREYIWLGGPEVAHAADPGADTDFFDQGFATLTSLSLNLTAGDDLAERVLSAR
jgi:5'-nucleotidase